MRKDNIKKVLRIAAVVLFFLVWLGWCFNVDLSGLIQELSIEPNISTLGVLLGLIGFLVLGAALTAVAFGVVMVLTWGVAKIVLRVAGFSDIAEMVDTLHQGNLSTAYIACLAVFTMFIITVITRTDFVIWLITRFT